MFSEVYYTATEIESQLIYIYVYYFIYCTTGIYF